MASMDHIDAARARLHSLFNASFEKLDDTLSNAMYYVLSIIGTNEGPAVNNFVEVHVPLPSQRGDTFIKDEI
ncbi:hypothetical protein FOQG_03192 [Fusarium oxysporum f. sp. raphani 54005]|uniref:Uncharacterized protein n=1 Tax=Fusarium oxysporum f. sp. raphani 54005 TaxID=1089458 RepID=X0CXG3_FUSOX|nr:hypothetical protein FOQG_03192 [Fusarium oxysporum f. sp. raphani 54005]KAJ4058734.1 hypothetical protein NW763_006157 [Fusarium oxysporum]WKT39593.1 hypothetical protein QSH57_001412 [Fusarium oxysporum f. sp. vasinfectum]KAJ4060121.1 hypothetical protein NW758_000673 [Fusarium oxysporum]KAJ4063181.1 hypothetical protein NW753_004642 [Fusarium oxysporum]